MEAGHTIHISEFLQTVDLITDFALSDKEKLKMIESEVKKEYQRVGTAAQPKREVIEDIESIIAQKFNEDFPDVIRNTDHSTIKQDRYGFYKAGYKAKEAALLSKQNSNTEKKVSERIAGYIHEIDSLRGTIRELVEKIKEGKEGKEGGVWVKADWILKMRDALVKSDYNEVYHWLYQIASPDFDKNIDDVWTEIENIASKEAVVSKQLYEFVKASEDQPEHKIQVAFRVNGFYYTAGEYNINSRSFFSIEGKDYDVKVVEWLKQITIEQGNSDDKQILLTKVQEQEIEIASLKNKVKELQSDYMAVQTEIQSNENH